MARSLVVINPHASRLKDDVARTSVAQGLRQVLERRDGTAPQIVIPASAADAVEVATRAVAEGIGSVVGVGGDGTLQDLAHVVASTDVPLGIVPGGTGNILAGVLGVPGSLDAAVVALADAVVRTIDLGDVRVELDAGPGEPPEIRHMTFVVGAGIGFDARVMSATPPDWKRRMGRTAYFVQAAWLAARIDAVPYRVTVDGELIEIDGSIALVTNFAELVPGVIRTRLPVVPDDGLLDVFVVGARNPVAGMRGLVNHLRRTELGHDEAAGTIRLRGRHVRLEALPHEPLQVDGDPLGPGALEATIRPGALRVLVPPGSWTVQGPVDAPAASEGVPG